MNRDVRQHRRDDGGIEAQNFIKLLEAVQWRILRTERSPCCQIFRFFGPGDTAIIICIAEVDD